MIIELAIAAVAAFTPFYVGPVSTAPDATHYTEYENDPTLGRMYCENDIYWNSGPADCQVVPENSAPDITQPGWALQSGSDWASKNPADYTSDSSSTNFWGVQDVNSPNWINPFG